MYFVRLRLPFALLAALPFCLAVAVAQTPPPGMVWSTFLGGGDNDLAIVLRVAGDGDVILAGTTRSTNFPIAPGAYQSTHGGNPTGNNWLGDGFFTRIRTDARGRQQLVWSSFLGGAGGDYVHDIVVDPGGAITVCGSTDSPAFDGKRTSGGVDAFVARFVWTGTRMLRVWSVLLGTPANDGAFGLAVHPSGSIVVFGTTNSTAFPGTQGRYQPANAGGYDFFLAVLDAGGSLQRATYLGGSGFEGAIPGSALNALGPAGRLVLDGAGNPVVLGASTSSNFPTTPGAFQPTFGGGAGDVVVARLDLDLRRLTYGTYLGGSSGEYALGLAIGEDGRVTIAGSTASTNFPVTDRSTYSGTTCSGTPPIGDATVTTLDLTRAGRQGLVWSTYLGTPGCEQAIGVAVDRCGAVTLAVYTSSSAFPTTPGAFQARYGGGGSDGVVMQFAPPRNGIAQVVYSSYLGGWGSEVPVAVGLDGEGNAIVCGHTWSTNFPTTQGAYQRTFNGGSVDIFVTKLTMLPRPMYRVGRSTPACRWPIRQGVHGPVTPGSPFRIYACGAPPNTLGAMFLGQPNLPGLPLLNLRIHLGGPVVVVPAPAVGFDGRVDLTFQIPNSPLTGPIASQWLFYTSVTCPGSGPLAASEGLFLF